MSQEQIDQKGNQTRVRVAAGIGGALGVAVVLAVYELIGFKSFWLKLVLVGGGAGIGAFLARKIMSQEQINQKGNQTRVRVASAIGTGLGCGVGFTVYYWIGFESALLKFALAAVCLLTGGFLARKIASK